MAPFLSLLLVSSCVFMDLAETASDMCLAHGVGVALVFVTLVQKWGS